MAHLPSRYRFPLLSLVIAAVMVAFHLWSAAVPVRGVRIEEAREGAGDDGRERPGRLIAGFVHAAEGGLNDLQQRIRGPRPVHEDLVVVAIDERSLNELGLFPWDRRVTARGIEGLHRAGARAIGLDIAFSNEVPDAASEAYREALLALTSASETFPPEALSALQDFRGHLESRARESADARLAQALRAAPQTVQGVITYPVSSLEELGGQLEYQERALGPHLLRPPFPGRVPGSIYEVELEAVESFRQYGAQAPLPALVDAHLRLGMLNVSPDPDGVIRRLPLFARLERPAGLLPSLVLQTAAAAVGGTVHAEWSHVESRLLGARIDRDGAPPLRIPLLEDEPYTLVDYHGKGEGAFEQISFVDAVEGRLPPASLEGKVALVGVTYVGGFDQRVTPFSEYEPGVFVHASLLSNVLEQSFLRRPVSLRLWESLAMLLVALGLGLLLPRVAFRYKVLLGLAPAVAWLLVDQWLLTRGLQLASVLPVLSMTGCAVALLFLGYLTSDREKGQLRHAFEHYLNPSVMEQMLRHPEQLKLGGEKRELTVLFSDIRGFTTLSERMTPEALVKFINSYLTPMTDIVFEEGGTLDKYIGDAVMAFWGAPVAQEDHALRACRSAIRMQEALEALKLQWRAQQLPDVDIGIGVNTGPMIVGNMGSDVRFDYTVMGDAVNLGSRLEGTNKEYGTRILLSEATWSQVKDQVIARRLGAVRVKGKRRPVRIYELRGLGSAHPADARAIEAFEAAVDAFGERRFDEATALLEEVLGHWPDDPPSLRYLEQATALRNAPPEADWDGVYTATTK